MPIVEQLHLEERLLRSSPDASWLVLNAQGATEPMVILGLGNKPHELLNVSAVKEDGVRVVRRFTGGGTVLVDQGTFFTSIIGGDSLVAADGVNPYPRDIMKWTEPLFRSALVRHMRDGSFRLEDTDYVVQNAGDVHARKVGGNAQRISRRRWAHQTSWLWDYSDAKVAKYLAQPKGQPEYRKSRDHKSFMTRLNDVVVQDCTIDSLFDEVVDVFRTMGCAIQETDVSSVMDELGPCNTPAITRVLTQEEL